MSEPELDEVQVESRWEPAPAIVLVIALQVALGLSSRQQGWTL